MNLSEYQEQSRSTAIYKDKVIYPALGLCGEAGEVAEKIKKRLRDANSDFTDQKFLEEISKEIGDVLWYIANLSTDLNLNLGLIALYNLDKLNKRKLENKLSGSGDNR